MKSVVAQFLYKKNQLVATSSSNGWLQLFPSLVIVLEDGDRAAILLHCRHAAQLLQMLFFLFVSRLNAVDGNDNLSLLDRYIHIVGTKLNTRQ
jgi:hypothetical protein